MHAPVSKMSGFGRVFGGTVEALPPVVILVEFVPPSRIRIRIIPTLQEGPIRNVRAEYVIELLVGSLPFEILVRG